MSETDEMVEATETTRSNEVPEVGMEVYIPTSIYIDHGRDDFAGGLCTISKVVRLDSGRFYITVAERPHASYTWDYIRDSQEKWATEYGTRRGHADPDLSPLSNPTNYGWDD